MPAAGCAPETSVSGMSEDLFRIVISVAVALACLAFLVQAGVAIALFGLVRKMQRKMLPLADRAGTVMEKAGPVIDQARAVMEKAVPVIDQGRVVLQKVAPATEQAGLLMEKTGAAVAKAEAMLAAAQQMLEEARPRVAELSAEAVIIARTGREHVERIGGLVQDAGDRARTRIEQIDHSVESTVEQVGQVGESMKRAVLRPVREVNGVAAGISAAISTLVGRGRPESVASATQDEEMFI